MSRGQGWYAQRKQERILKPGDRIAVLGRGVAVVKRGDDKHICAVLWNRSGLRIRRSEIVWVEQNIRWEASADFMSIREMEHAVRRWSGFLEVNAKMSAGEFHALEEPLKSFIGSQRIDLWFNFQHHECSCPFFVSLLQPIRGLISIAQA